MITKDRSENIPSHILPKRTDRLTNKQNEEYSNTIDSLFQDIKKIIKPDDKKEK